MCPWGIKFQETTWYTVNIQEVSFVSPIHREIIIGYSHLNCHLLIFPQKTIHQACQGIPGWRSGVASWSSIVWPQSRLQGSYCLAWSHCPPKSGNNGILWQNPDKHFCQSKIGQEKNIFNGKLHCSEHTAFLILRLWDLFCKLWKIKSQAKTFLSIAV